MSWQQLSDIMAVARQEREQIAAQPPTRCPNDGTVLDTGPNGELHCPFDGWIWDGSPTDT